MGIGPSLGLGMGQEARRVMFPWGWGWGDCHCHLCSQLASLFPFLSLGSTEVGGSH